MNLGEQSRTTLERALELASSGKHRSLLSIRKELMFEHRENVREDLSERAIIAELKRRIKLATTV